MKKHRFSMFYHPFHNSGGLKFGGEPPYSGAHFTIHGPFWGPAQKFLELPTINCVGDIKFITLINGFHSVIRKTRTIPRDLLSLGGGGGLQYSPHNSSHSSLDLNLFLLPPYPP